MGDTARKVIPTATANDDSASLFKRLENIQSKEIVIAFAGPMGTQINIAQDEVKKTLEGDGYIVRTIKVSDLIIDLYSNLPSEIKGKFNTPFKDFPIENLKDNGVDLYKRIYLLQELGNFFRETYENNVLIQGVIKEVALLRMKDAKPDYENYKNKLETENPSQEPISLTEYAISKFRPKKTAYLVNQLKHPDEANLLRRVYSDIFYLIGIIENKNQRVSNIEKIINVHYRSDSPLKAAELEQRDKAQEEKHGQQLEKTLQLADYFIYEAALDREKISQQISRFLSLVHSDGICTPTLDEFGMYTAYSASLGSACLSRQVGACIVSEDGDILSTGRNDVPKFGGDLYSSDGASDHRCFKTGEICYNDKYKNDMIIRLKKHLDKLDVSLSERELSAIFYNTGIKDLIEFSRAVHAEMDAIITLARSSHQTTNRATLYSTTFPCHNCARHIVASGINRAVYIEPYEKSLAIDLHSDSICMEENRGGKVIFEHFKGVAPSRFQAFFSAKHARKNADGSYRNPASKEQGSPEYLEGYRELEVKVQRHLTEAIPNLAE